MPAAQRKIIGPDESIPYNLYTLNKESIDIEITHRKDDRKFDDSRKIYAKLGIITQAKGSAYMEMGNTKVLAAVLDPRELSKQNRRSSDGALQIEFKYTRYATRNKSPLAITEAEKSFSLALKKALQPAVCRHEFSNFQIDIIVYVLEDDGSVLSSAINCSGLALVDGGIPMYDIITASTIAMKMGKIIIDPTSEEEEICNYDNNSDSEYGILVEARLESKMQTTEFYQTGYLSSDTLKRITEASTKINYIFAETIRQILVQHVKTKLAKNKENIN